MTDITNRTMDPLVEITDMAATRRGFLAIAGIGGLGMLAAACGDSSGSSSSSATGPGSASSSPSTGSGGKADRDMEIAILAGSLEVLAIGTYKAVLDAASGGRLGTVPPAVATFVQTAMGHHQMALDRINGILTRQGAVAVSSPPADLAVTINGMLAKVTDAVGAARLALFLEQTAADTYLTALPAIKIKPAITLVGALQSVDQEHAAILLYVLGQYPVPDTFQKGDKAYAPPASSATTSASASS